MLKETKTIFNHKSLNKSINSAFNQDDREDFIKFIKYLSQR